MLLVTPKTFGMCVAQYTQVVCDTHPTCVTRGLHVCGSFDLTIGDLYPRNKIFSQKTYHENKIKFVPLVPQP